MRADVQAIVDKYKPGRWAVAYYWDGRVVDATYGLTGNDARGVQAILQYNHAVGVEVVTERDNYVLEEESGLWKGVNDRGLDDFLFDVPGIAFGRMLANVRDYRKIMQMVNDDKTGWLATENRPDKR